MESPAALSFSRFALLVFPTTALISSVCAQLPTPELHVIYPPAIRAGTTGDVVLEGINLEGLKELQFSVAGVKASPFMVPQSDLRKHRWQEGTKFSVTIPDQVAPGRYEVRALAHYGLSNPRILTIIPADTSLSETEASHDSDTAPTLEPETFANGRFDADQIDYFRFQANKGEAVHLSAVAEAIDSKGDPTLLVMDSKGVILQKNRDYLYRDSLISFSPPSDGVFTVGIHDFLYRGGAPYLFRIWKGPQLHAVLPPAIAPGQSATVSIFGNLSQEVKEVSALPPKEISRQLRHAAPTDALVRTFAFQTDRSNSLPIGITDPQPKPRTQGEEYSLASNLPESFFGYFHEKGETHRYRFAVRKGVSYSVSVFGGALLGRIDPYVVLEKVDTDGEGNENLKLLKESDDFSVDSRNTFPDISRDPYLVFEAEEDGLCQVTVFDQYQETGVSSAYVVRISEAKPSFDLIALLEPEVTDGKQARPATATLRKGGSIAMEVKAIRKGGMDGPIRLRASDLPEGVSFPETILPPGQNSVRIVFQASTAAVPGTRRILLEGHSGEGANAISATAVPAFVINPVSDANKERVRTRAEQDLFLTVIDEESPANVTITSPIPEAVSVGGKLEIPLELSVIGPEVPDALTVDIVGLPGLKKSPTLAISPKKKTGTLILNIKEDGNFKLNTGQTTFLVRAVGTIKKFRHYPERVTYLEEDLAHLESVAKSASKDDEPLQKRIAEEKKKIESELKRARDIAKEKDVRFAVFTKPVTITILPAQNQ